MLWDKCFRFLLFFHSFVCLCYFSELSLFKKRTKASFEPLKLAKWWCWWKQKERRRRKRLKWWREIYFHDDAPHEFLVPFIIYIDEKICFFCFSFIQHWWCHNWWYLCESIQCNNASKLHRLLNICISFFSINFFFS